MVAPAMSVSASFSVASRNRPPTSYYIAGLSAKGRGFPIKLDEEIFIMLVYGAIEAKKGNPPVMPSVMTPGGPLDLSSVLFKSRIIFIGHPVNAEVAQRVISQLVSLATVDEDADILGHVEDVRRQVNEAVQSHHILEKVQQYTQRDRFPSVSEALDFGLIDGVLETEY